MNTSFTRTIFLALLSIGPATLLAAPADVGQVKISTGAVHIERGTERLAAPVGTHVQAADTIVTGADGSVGITFADNSRLSTGPNSAFVINKYSFDRATHRGTMDTSLQHGTLSVISGKLAKRSPEAMTVRTPTTILGVRGTEFVVRAAE